MTREEQEHDLRIAQTSIRLSIATKQAVEERLAKIKYTAKRQTLTSVIEAGLHMWIEHFDTNNCAPLEISLALTSDTGLRYKAQSLTDREQRYVGALLEIMRSGYDLAVNAVLGNIDAFVEVARTFAATLKERGSAKHTI